MPHVARERTLTTSRSILNCLSSNFVQRGKSIFDHQFLRIHIVYIYSIYYEKIFMIYNSHVVKIYYYKK
jgi:hypothetical protein